MSEPPPFDPDSTAPQGDLKAFTRRKAPVKRYLGPAIAAAIITLGFLLLLGWIAALVINRIG